MTRVAFQQLIESHEALVNKWPRLGSVVSAEDVSLGMDALRQRVADGSLDVTASEAAANEALNLYNKVIADGRFVGLLAGDPEQAASGLGMTVSAEAADVLRRAVNLDPELAQGEASAASPVAVFIVIFIAIVVAAQEPEQMVVDESGLVKY